MDMAPMFIHAPAFIKEYNQMWKDLDSTPLMWIGLLFSILGLASHFCAVSGDELHTLPEPFISTSEMSSYYRNRTAQCLVEVNYLKPGRYTVETLCFYHALELLGAKDSEFGAYVVLGIIVRVAMRLGYHRDASRYANISLFDGEMRRRAWSMIFQIDIFTSTQARLPRIIRDGEADTAEPKNLLDTDFDESMTELPHPRPSTDVTPVAYVIFKPPSYGDVMRLDSQLTATHATLPPYLTVRPLSLSITDGTDLIIRRYALEVCFQKNRCVLHRKYLIPGQSNTQYRYSRTASVNAAMKLLDIQLTFNEASQPGGRLSRERWRMSALINQEYILAAMILCLDLSCGMRFARNLPSGRDDEVERMWSRDMRLQRLKTGYEVWSESSRISAMVAKAAEALKVMLKDLEPINSETRDAKPVATSCLMSDLLLVVNPASVSDAVSAL
ncbi:hypothetical protein G7Y89_g4754 [Cudoniella acicularis]|uniref:Xylanolytic transcriptional activator regulatory domain-containing protein n=1 Tax=Cudoniella acicularis TaxID=354080 RepID=A0A8H4RQ96_9HELO|nr:hypothetical protein G7Y89_g4754 [Cudoniella acicularis]